MLTALVLVCLRQVRKTLMVGTRPLEIIKSLGNSVTALAPDAREIAGSYFFRFAGLARFFRVECPFGSLQFARSSLPSILG